MSKLQKTIVITLTEHEREAMSFTLRTLNGLLANIPLLDCYGKLGQSYKMVERAYKSLSVLYDNEFVMFEVGE